MNLFDDIPIGTTISEIKPLASDPNLKRIRANGRIVVTLRTADIDALKLHVNSIWTEKLADAVAQAVASNRARKAAMQLIGRRALSRGELIRWLVRKRHEARIAASIADELAADHWIDDAELGRSLIHQLTRKRPASHQLLVIKLSARLIDSWLAQQLADEALADVSPIQSALELARRHLVGLRKLAPTVAQRRLAGTLARRGFDEDTIAEVVQQLFERVRDS